MGVLAITILASSGLLAGVAFLISGKKQPDKPITMQDEFYNSLNYFKLDKKTIYAIKNDGSTDEILYEGNSVDSAEKHLKELQLGFEKWLEHNSLTKTKSSDSKVNFS